MLLKKSNFRFCNIFNSSVQAGNARKRSLWPRLLVQSHFLFYLCAIFFLVSMPLLFVLSASMELIFYPDMGLCRAPLSLFNPPPAELSRRRSKRWKVSRHNGGSFECSQSFKGSQLIVSITGASGFIGQRLVQRLLTDDHIVRILTRSRRNALIVFPVEKFPEVVIAEEEEWNRCIEGSNAVVNLAGMPISTRWSSEIKKEIKLSRVKVTSKVVDLINKTNSSMRPSVLISATAIGYYGTSETIVFDETSPSGNDYLSEVCREWEAKALEVDNDVRLALIRIGIVLGKDGGALAKMIPFFKLFAGGPIGSGKQWFSWIHMEDLVSLIYEAMRNPSYKGIINGTAPNPVRLSEMCDQLGEVMRRPSWLPVPDFALKAVLGEGATLVLDGQKVLPVKPKELGFTYKYPFIRDALRDIISSGSG